MRNPHDMRDWALAAEAMVWLAAARVVLGLLPFERVMRLAARPPRSAAQASPCSAAVAKQVRWAVLAGARRAPWRALCFQQGLAAHVMLRRRGLNSRLYYGVRSDGSLGPSAHVWVRLDGRDVVGGDIADRFAILAVMPARAGADRPALSP